MKRLLLCFAAALLTSSVFLIPACGSDKSRAGFDDQGPGGPLDEGGPGGFGQDGEAGGACKGACSGDLHAVLDCNGNVQSTCPPDKGCAGGACIAPCDAAAANKSSVGCDYLVYPPPFFSGSTSCTGAFVANTWGTPVKLTITRGGQTYSADQFAYLPSGSGAAITYAPLTGGMIPPGQVALVLLNQEGPACPAGTKSATGPVAVNGTGIGDAFRLQTDAPVVAYDIFPYGGGSTAVTSATLLIPTTAWGDNYVGTTAYPETIAGASPWLGIVASEDGTEVTVVAPVAIAGGTGVAAAAANAPTKYNLQKGQYVQLLQPADLTGTIIKANKPIGSWAGNKCTNVPMGQVACDGMHQQIPPVRALGSSYVAARYRNRRDGVEETPPWRIVGAVDGTTLTYDPPQAGAPATIDAGKLALFNAAGPFVVRSQDDKHPFFFAGYMTGCSTIGQQTPLGCAGDPEFVLVIPPDQYLASYVFFTDPTYPETDLVFVRKKGADGTFKDVTLDCVGTVTGWLPVAADYEYTRVDLVRRNFEKQGTCDNGRHEAKSAGRFGLTVWGWGSGLTTSFPTSAVSYAYPAGASILPINDVVVPAVVK
ncbi:hypothetical protein BH11MYX4_BH11MYX4_58180 [soil metagenome]